MATVTALAVALSPTHAIATQKMPDGHASASTYVSDQDRSKTTVPLTAGKAQGSNKWGVIGDVRTIPLDGSKTYNYGIGLNPKNGQLVVSDSAKIGYSRTECLAAGAGFVSSCKTGTPRVFAFDRLKNTNDPSLSTYSGNGQYSSGVGPSSGRTDNLGVGGAFASGDARKTYNYPNWPTENHGPRHLDFTPEGEAWVVDTEHRIKFDPKNPPPYNTITRFDSGLQVQGYVGWTPTSIQPVKNNPNFKGQVHDYPVGIATAPDGTLLSTSQYGYRVNRWNPDGTYNATHDSKIPADQPFGTVINGLRAPYTVAVDPVNGDYYIGAIEFRDSSVSTLPAVIEKFDKDGNFIKHVGQERFKQEVFLGTEVHPQTRHLFAWTQTQDAIQEFDADGNWVREWKLRGNDTTHMAAELPGLFAANFGGTIGPRAIDWDEHGHMYLTVAQGTNDARVMILGQTPDPVKSACVSSNGSDATISIDCETPIGNAVPYGQTPIQDFVVERSDDGGTSWKVVDAPKSIDKERTVTNVTATTRFRVSAWNEAGNSDWVEAKRAIDDEKTAVWGDTVDIEVLSNDSGVGPADAAALSLLDTNGNKVNTLPATPQGGGSPVGHFVVDNGKIRFLPNQQHGGYQGELEPVTYVWGTGCEPKAQIKLRIANGTTLIIEKQLEGSGAGIAMGTEFSFSYVCTGPDDFRERGTGLGIKGQGTAEIDLGGMPEGTTCEISEDAPEQTVSIAVSDPTLPPIQATYVPGNQTATATIGRSKLALATVTNRYEVVPLTSTVTATQTETTTTTETSKETTTTTTEKEPVTTTVSSPTTVTATTTVTSTQPTTSVTTTTAPATVTPTQIVITSTVNGAPTTVTVTVPMHVVTKTVGPTATVTSQIPTHVVTTVTGDRVTETIRETVVAGSSNAKCLAEATWSVRNPLLWLIPIGLIAVIGGPLAKVYGPQFERLAAQVADATGWSRLPWPATPDWVLQLQARINVSLEAAQMIGGGLAVLVGLLAIGGYYWNECGDGDGSSSSRGSRDNSRSELPTSTGTRGEPTSLSGSSGSSS